MPRLPYSVLRRSHKLKRLITSKSSTMIELGAHTGESPLTEKNALRSNVGLIYTQHGLHNVYTVRKQSSVYLRSSCFWTHGATSDPIIGENWMLAFSFLMPRYCNLYMMGSSAPVPLIGDRLATVKSNNHNRAPRVEHPRSQNHHRRVYFVGRYPKVEYPKSTRPVLLVRNTSAELPSSSRPADVVLGFFTVKQKPRGTSY